MVGVGSRAARPRGNTGRWWALLVTAVLVTPVAAAARPGQLEQVGSWAMPPGARAGAMWLVDGDRALLRTEDGFVAVDPETGVEQARVSLDPEPWHAQGVTTLHQYAAGREHTAALHPATARLAVPYGIDMFREDGRSGWLPIQGAIWAVEGAQDPAGMLDTLAGPTAENTANGQACVSEVFAHAGGGQCVGGVHILDTASLQVVRTVPVQQLRPDTAGMAPILRAVTWSPSGKVQLLLEDLAHQVEAFTAFSHNHSRQFRSTSVHHLVQLDPESGAQDWAVPVAACAGTRDRVEDPTMAANTTAQPYPAAVVASSDTIAVGCAGAGLDRPAVLVRIPLEADGSPAGHGLPLPDPAWQVSTVAGAGALEFRPDAEAGRLLVRIHPGQSCATPLLPTPCTSSPEERWLAVDVSTGTVDGVWQFEVRSERDLAAALDPKTGRLVLRAGTADGATSYTVIDTRRPDRAPQTVTVDEPGPVGSLAARSHPGQRLQLFAIGEQTVRLYRD